MSYDPKLLNIPGAMMWKYGVKCSKTADKQGIATWESETISKPTPAQIQAIMAEYAAYLEANAYVEKREKEYPSIGDQLDAIWKGGSDFDTMKTKVMAVKEKYPKP